MHSTTIGKTTFHHNGGYDGDVIIQVGDLVPDEIKVPFEDLRGFVANYVRDTRISELESMGDNELLGVK
jgi:hypothetical protein